MNQFLEPMNQFSRTDNRAFDELRAVKITPGFLAHAEGSALIEMGNTRVICAASVEDRLPPHLRNSRTEGWVTAEYGMLPRSTHTRTAREVGRGPSGRTHEIQRLIGRSLRAISNRTVLGERTITLDCDVLQADGGTRTAAINGALVALHDAFVWLSNQNHLARPPLHDSVAAISVGLVRGHVCIDLDYVEDSGADVDMNVVMTGKGRFIEVQGTGERATFNEREMRSLLRLARAGIRRVTAHQRKLLSGSGLLPE